MPTSPITFPLTKLFPELRRYIWLEAIDASTPRTLPVTAFCFGHSTSHSCLTIGGRFCGLHGRCARWRREAPEPSHISVCMSDGYFSMPQSRIYAEQGRRTSAMLRISLACREACEAVNYCFPNTMRVWDGKWSMGSVTRSRLIRYDPQVDVLLLMDLQGISTMHLGQGLYPEYEQRQFDKEASSFPSDSRMFTEFRTAISSFRYMAFRSQGNHRRVDAAKEYAYEYHVDERHFDEGKGRDFAELPDFKFFIFYFTALKGLYYWPDPEVWHEVRNKAVCRIDDVQSIVRGYNRELNDIKDMCEDILADYAEYAQIQNDHLVDGEQHWVPKPKPLDRIGCFAAEEWVVDNVNELGDRRVNHLPGSGV